MTKKTNQGYEIIQEAKVFHTVYALGKHPNKDCPAPYVTWEWTEQGGYYWGHYFGNYLEALKDLYTRALNETEFLIDQAINN